MARKKREVEVQEEPQPLDLLGLVGRKVAVSVNGGEPKTRRLVHVDLNCGVLTFKTKTKLLLVPIDCVVLEVPIT